MKRFMRPDIQIGFAILGAAITLAPFAHAQVARVTQIVEEPNPLLLHSGSPGYLGVLVGDIDNDSANKLKLKDVRGAVITLIDHDAPAAQVGLRVNDVLLEVNGQAVESAEAFGRMMREIPPGRKITVVISRDGATQTVTVQLADRKKLDTDIWNKLNSGSDISSPVEGLGILGTGAGGDAPLPGGFHMPFVGSSTLKVGAVVEPLTSQMADYLGIANGLMVKQVARKSEAAVAGIKAFDVILKVGADNVSTVSDWDRAMRANQGKTVALTVLRDKKQVTLTLQVDSKKKSELEFHQFLPDGPCPQMAFVDPDVMGDLMGRLELNESDLQSMRNQAEALQEQMQQWKDDWGKEHFGITQEQAEEMRKQAQQFADSFKNQHFGIDQKQMDEMKRQMQQFQKDFKPFQFDQKQMEEWNKQMKEFGQGFAPQSFKFDPNQMYLFRKLETPKPVPNFEERQREQMKQERDRLKQQLEEQQELGFDHLV
jgi:serine protease Do